MMMNLALFITWMLALVMLPVAQDSGLSLTATAGFDRLYKEGAAVPVVVNARNVGVPVEGEIRVIVGDAGSPVYTAPISLPTQSDKRLALYVQVPAFARNVEVRLVSDGRVLATSPVTRLNLVGRDDLLYGVVSSNPGSLAYVESVTGSRSDAAVALLELTDLPDVSSAWNALDILILDDSDTSRLTSGQFAAMRAWVESGGQLVVTGGPGGLQTAAGLAELLPVIVTGTDTVDDLPALRDFAGVDFNTQGPFVLSRSSLREGELLIHQDGLPLLARKSVGLGDVYFLALDPKLVPLLGWPGTGQVWELIANEVPVPPPWGRGVQDSYSASQVVSSIPGLTLPSIIQLVLFLLIYIAVIGPVNYLVLSRLNRRELAWLTIPILVLLFTGATFLTSFRTRGNTATLIEMSAAYGSIEAERIKTKTLTGLYSPGRGRYNVSLPYDSTAFDLPQSFGTVFGSSNLNIIERTGELILRDIRTDTGEIVTFIADSHLARPALSAEARLIDGGRFVEVTVRNEGDQVFENAVLIFGDSQLALGDLRPGEEQTQRLPIVTGSANPEGSTPLFAGGSINPNPLVNDPSFILGTTNYFVDREVYPRWQLVQSLYDGSGTTVSALPNPTEAITLAGWIADSQLPVTVNTDTLEQSMATLYLLEIPVR